MASSPVVSNSAKPSIEDETTPLLVSTGVDPSRPEQDELLSHQNNGAGNENYDKPLPKMQIALLCFARLPEAIAYFSIFPFINEMVEVVGGVNQKDVGFYTGVIESLFSVIVMFTMIPWGRASDKFGRKPVLVVSLVGVSLATAAFGFCTKICTVRTMISENSTSRTQARAFSWFSFSNNLGIFLGPFIGGVLSNPATEYPRVFGKIQLLRNFPYALPTLITGVIGALALIATILFTKETLTLDLRTSHKASTPMSSWKLVKSPGVAPVIFIYGHVMLLAYAYTSIANIFQYTSANLGGFGFSHFRIAMFVALTGVAQSLWTLVAFPTLQHRFGTGGLLRGCAFIWPLGFAMMPLCNVLLRRHWPAGFWILAPIANIVSSGASMAFTGVQLMLNDIAPSHATLGTLNGIALPVDAGLRAVAPSLFASIFAIGVRTQVLWGYLIWMVLIALAILLSLALRWLPAKAEGNVKQTNGNDA
ncbi:MFS transporter [Calycina marina]|uniref:MFS transporter n=1 Tax=Calycina marina TaxID=1763456 RepID=A0A9P7Z5H4_9HELO|nr:MFS transporter [Calycina marina]